MVKAYSSTVELPLILFFLNLYEGGRNASCSGEMHRYDAEHQLRRQLTNVILTLRDESMGSEQD